MRKIFLMTVLAILPGWVLLAQDHSFMKEGKYGPYETNCAKDNWFIGADGGIQTVFGNSNSHDAFTKRLTPVVDIYVGKWFTPNVGMRVVGSWGKIKGYASSISGFTNEQTASATTDYYKTKYTLWSVQGNLLYNLTNGLWGYRSDRLYNCIPYVGVGLKRAVRDDSHRTNAGVYFGVINQFRLTDAWMFNLELKSGTSDAYTEVRVKNNWDCVVGITAGFAYKFKVRDFKHVSKPDYSAYDQKIESLLGEMELSNAQINRLREALALQDVQEAEVIAESTPCEIPQQSIFFHINSAQVTKGEELNLHSFAEAIKKMPNDKFYVTGYADLQTGTKAYNENLAHQRAKAVAQILTDKYGVDANQLIVNSGNLDNPPFKDTIYNRAVILKK